MQLVLEIIGRTVSECMALEKAGANRLELCSNMAEGGTTPAYATIALTKKYVKIPVFPMIRPRGGNFYYNDIEFETMALDIETCKKLGCEGVVFGMLTAENKVDVTRCRQLLKLAQPMQATFHRAFDLTPDASEALETLVALGFSRILTSGQAPSAMQGKALLAQLVKQAGNRIIILPGGGVRSDNLAALAAFTKATEFHASVMLKADGM